MATTILQQHRSDAAAQLTAVSVLAAALSGEAACLDSDNVLFAVESVSRSLAAEMAKPKADAAGIAKVTDALAALLLFASESREYQTGNGVVDKLKAEQRVAFFSCGCMAEIAAELCRKANG